MDRMGRVLIGWCAMTAPRYVRHVSGQGEKWAIRTDYTLPGRWCCVGQNGDYVQLPQSEYVLVELPERWVDISQACDFGLRDHDHGPIPFQHNPYSEKCNTLFEWPYLAELEGYRLRKVLLAEADPPNETPGQGTGYSSRYRNRWAFIVERRTP